MTGKAIKFKEGPELRKGLLFVYEAFWELDSERTSGWDRGRIPWHRIVFYATFYELSEEQSDRFIAHIQAMDLAYVRKMNEKREEKKGK